MNTHDSSSMFSKVKNLTLDTLNPLILNVQYAVRGPIVTKAGQLQKELETGQKMKFKKIIRANIGDCHAVGQSPISFYRQVLAACTYPPLISSKVFPDDVNKRATSLLKCMKGSIGCYTDSVGIESIRKNVSQYIEQRDGFKCDYHNIFLTNGASTAIRTILYSLMRVENDKNTGVMVPIPQYPLYSASLSEFDGHLISYYLDEASNWGLDLKECERAYEECLEKCNPRAMVVINPGNPTGQVLGYSNMVEIVNFCHKRGLILLADEVYQENVHAENTTFHSFKKVVQECGYTEENFQLVSFHSGSKGFYGECGIRGGYMELFGFDIDVRNQLAKLLSAQLCSSSLGQIIIDMVTKPPSPTDTSYPLYIKEKENIISSLKYKANYLFEELNEIPGISCNKIQGAMYAFASLHLPQKFINEAKSIKLEPDEHYCFQLLEETGICVVPGSGFKQKPGTYHFRTTIIPPVEQIKEMVELIKKFNTKLFESYQE